MKVWILYTKSRYSEKKVVGAYDSEEKMNVALKHIQALLPHDLLEFSVSVVTVE